MAEKSGVGEAHMQSSSFFIHISYLATTVKGTTKEKQPAPITDGQRRNMQFYFGIVVPSSIMIFKSLSLIHLSHRTTLRCIIFILCPLSRYVFTWLRHSNGPSPMQSAVYLSIN